MYLTLNDLIGIGELKAGDTARGAFTAALPKPPIRHMWQRIAGTGETPSGDGLTTYLYRLVRYEDEPEPIDFSKLVKSEAEMIAELNAKDEALQKLVAETEAAEAKLAAAKAAQSAAAETAAARELAVKKAASAEAARKIAAQRAALLPWYRRPLVLYSAIGGTVLASIAAALILPGKR